MNTQQSEQLFEVSRKKIPGGVNSPVRAFGAVGRTPLFIKNAKGSHITDEDGNTYIDYVCSWGPGILGHAHPQVIEAVQKACADGLTFGAPTRKEYELAELICEAMPSIEKVRLVNSGTEATMSAIRTARGYTGRDYIIKFKAGEFGYMLTDRPGGRDPRRYSMNENCTLRVLRHRYAQHIGAPLDSVTGELIFDRYDAGDPVCQRLVAEFFNGLGHGLYNLVHIFDPQTIFIGGGVVERPGFLTLLRQHLAWFGIADYLDTVSHGNDAGLIGAVYHFNQLYRSPDDDRH